MSAVEVVSLWAGTAAAAGRDALAPPPREPSRARCAHPQQGLATPDRWPSHCFEACSLGDRVGGATCAYAYASLHRPAREPSKGETSTQPVLRHMGWAFSPEAPEDGRLSPPSHGSRRRSPLHSVRSYSFRASGRGGDYAPAPTRQDTQHRDASVAAATAALAATIAKRATRIWEKRIAYVLISCLYTHRAM